MRRPLLRVLASCALALALPASSLLAQSQDKVARGLALYIQMPHEAGGGTRIPIMLEAYGFPSAVTPVGLGQATVEAAWDPAESGGATDTVTATTDDQGRAILLMPVPEGIAMTMKLLLAVRFAGKSRTYEANVTRGASETLEFHISDAEVPPGGLISGWASVRKVGTGLPVVDAPVDFNLAEGALPRWTDRQMTDANGRAAFHVPVPSVNELSWKFTVGAKLESGESASAHVALRNETPGTPQLRAECSEVRLVAGKDYAFRAFLRDATGMPLPNHEVEYWSGPQGTKAPTDEVSWLRLGKRARTDSEGKFELKEHAPKLVALKGTSIAFQVRSKVDGYPVTAHAALAVASQIDSFEVKPQSGALIPGVKQQLFAIAKDGEGKPIKGEKLILEGDGLHAEVTTNEHGEAEFSWNAPNEVGANRNVGSCAGGIAARVSIRFPTRTRDPEDLCVAVDRDADGYVEISPRVARVGELVHVHIVGARKKPGAQNGYSVILRSDGVTGARGLWISDPEKGADFTLSDDTVGVYNVVALSPREGSSAEPRGAGLVVAPKVIPDLTLTQGASRLAPGGEGVVEGYLRDEQGKPLQGTIAAVLGDVNAGESLRGLDAVDVRNKVCLVERERCKSFLSHSAAEDPIRRAMLAERTYSGLVPVSNPKERSKEELRQAFASTLKSLEGAVFQATQSRDALRDVRRRGAGNSWAFNPEMLTLTVDAMDPKPVTPGGEPMALNDLIAVDNQVSFDTVARRITRLKIFHVLVAARAFKKEKDPDEPIFSNPNVILRKLREASSIDDSALLDPWGGEIQFIKTGAVPKPFLTIAKGFELHSPGPDGRIGTPDDVKDPFERVLRSQSPYAEALHEDRIVDAQYDMEVADSTVEAWKTLLEAETGQELGNIGGIGLTGSGSGGGSGFGSGHGSLGGTHRASSPDFLHGRQVWLAPVRTDDNGHFVIRVPFGPEETTYRVGVIATPDGGRPVVETIDLPVSLPLSAKAHVGVRWTVGDQGSVPVTITNRVNTARTVHVDLGVRGGTALGAKQPGGFDLNLPAQGSVVTEVAIRAVKTGDAELVVHVKGGSDEDTLHASFGIEDAAEPVTKTRAVFSAKENVLEIALAPGETLASTPSLMLSRGVGRAVREALDSLAPDGLRSPTALSESLEVATRVERWALAKQDTELAKRAAQMRKAAEIRYLALAPLSTEGYVHTARAFTCASIETGQLIKAVEGCPPAWVDEAEVAEVEPGPVALKPRQSGNDNPAAAAQSAQFACWDSFAVDAVAHAKVRENNVQTARLLLAFSERNHRLGYLNTLVDALRKGTRLAKGGAIEGRESLTRANRAFIYAALLRAQHIGSSPASKEELAGWIGAERDAQGGYGSPAATRAVVTALLASGLDSQEPSRVVYGLPNGTTGEITLGGNDSQTVMLPAATTRIWVRVSGPAVLARLVRPMMRSWSMPPNVTESPVSAEITWPREVRSRTALVKVVMRASLRRGGNLEARLRLPPGVALAAPVTGVVQAQGQLAISRPASTAGDTLEIPLRFATVGRFTAPEARVYVAREELPPAIVPAQAFEVFTPAP